MDTPINKTPDKVYYFVLLVIAGCSIAMTWKYLQYNPAEDFPTKEEILKAVENGAANLTVSPVMQSDN